LLVNAVHELRRDPDRVAAVRIKPGIAAAKPEHFLYAVAIMHLEKE